MSNGTWFVSRDWLLYLDDLISAAEKVQRFVRGRDPDSFATDEMLFDAVLFNLALIGEAVKKLPDDAKATEAGADWVGPARMRDLIAHHYFSVDPEIVWQAATLHVPKILDSARNLRSRYDVSE